MTTHQQRKSHRAAHSIALALVVTALVSVGSSPAVSAGRDTVITLDKAPVIADTAFYWAPTLSTTTRAITFDVASVIDPSAFTTWEFSLSNGTVTQTMAGGVRNGIATISTPAGTLTNSSWSTLDILGRNASATAYLTVRLHFDISNSVTGPTTVDWRVSSLEPIIRDTGTVWSYGDFEREPLVVSPGDTVTFVGTPGLFTTGRTGLMQNPTYTGNFLGQEANADAVTYPSAGGSRLTLVIPSPFWWDEAGESRSILASVSGRNGSVSEYVNLVYPIVYHRTLPPPVIDRVGGADRFAVAANIAARAYPGGAPIVVVANGVNYPDALSGAAAAAFLGGPLLLTKADALPPGVSEAIEGLGAARVIVVGGSTAVSDAVIDELTAIAGVTRVDRFAGDDRFETSRALARETFLATGSPVAYLATGLNFPDALSASAVAGRVDAPVLLIDGGSASIDAETAALLDDLGVDRVVIVGGRNSVSASIESSLRSSGQFSQVQRLSGSDRYETSSNIARNGFPQTERVFISTGLTFPDALAGAAWAATADAPLIVVPGSCIPRRVVTDLTNYQVGTVTILGGNSAVSTSVNALTVCPGFDWPAR